MDGHVVIIELENTLITVGDELVIKDKNGYFKARVLSLQENEEDVVTAEMGVVGIKLNKKVTKNSELYMRI